MADTTWDAFLHDFEDRLRHGDQVILGMCCALVSAGDPLDTPFGNSEFPREAKRSFREAKLRSGQMSTVGPGVDMMALSATLSIFASR